MGREVLIVPEMSCDHCRTAIEAAVTDLAGVRLVQVDLQGKRVTVEGEFSHDDVVAAIVDAGYEVAGRA